MIFKKTMRMGLYFVDDTLSVLLDFLALFMVVFCGAWQFLLNKWEKDFLTEKQDFEKQSKNKIENELNQKRKILLAEISTLKDEAFSRVRIEEEQSRTRIRVEREKIIIEQSNLHNEKNAVAHARRELEALTKKTRQNHPELASRIADAQYYLDMRSYDRLLYQKRPALKAAEEVKKLATEKRQLMQENRQLKYQLDFYEGLFPWLEQFKEIPSDEALEYASGTYGSDYDAVKKWLSPEEYEKLSNAEKYQRALDRWKNRKKEDWDVGIEYERYIGYRLECEGYKVSYPGAILGLKDMGRDLIASKDGQTLVIQCKRWAKEKTIHEKHIFQLFGSTTVLAAEHPGTRYKAVFITTATLSETAKKCAAYCGIAIVENCPMGEYPLIKCNVNKDGDRIYHLPFDQQYDKVVISKNKQSCYAWTTQEAEGLGFRRAYRWHPNKS